MLRKNLGDRLEKPKELSEKLLIKQKDIEFDMKFGFDRKRKRKQRTDSIESSSENATQVENFDNENEEAMSPTTDAQTNPEKIESEELEQELGARNVSRPNTYRQLSLLLSVISLLKNNLVFIQCFFENGGAWFLIPYFLMLFLFAVPMAIFELSLSQFTSLPLFAMFTRLHPFLAGIPYLILFTRIFYSCFHAIDPRFFIYFFKNIMIIMSKDETWLHCDSYKGIPCYDPTLHCRVNEFQFEGTCVPDEDPSMLSRLPEYSVINYGYYKDLRMVSLIPSQIFKVIKQFDVNDIAVSTLVILLISAYITIRGHRYMASVASALAFIPIIGMMPAVAITYYDISLQKSNVMIDFMEHNDWSKLLYVTTWVTAARICVKTVNIADGTLITLGSMADFRHNFVKDSILLAAFGAAYRILLCFTLLPLFYVGNQLLYPYSESGGVTKGVAQFHAIEVLFAAIPSYRVEGLGRNLTFLAYSSMFATINIAFITYQVITFEMFSSWFYFQFPRVLYMKAKYLRISITMAALSISFYLYSNYLITKMQSSDYDVLRMYDQHLVGILCAIGAAELVAVGVLYGHKKMISNTLTMLKECPKTHKLVYHCRHFLYIMWTFLLPMSCMISLYSTMKDRFQVLSFEILAYAFAISLPILYAFRMIIITKCRRQDFLLRGQTFRWEPANAGHARDAEYDERAAGIVD